MNKFLATAFVLVAFAANSFGQTTAQATATATIVTPISIMWVSDLDFGSLAIGAVDGTVVLDPFDNSRAVSGSVQALSALPGVAAQFTVSGQGGYTYDIVLPGSGMILTHTNLLDFMTAGSWTTAVQSGVLGTLDIGGSQTFSMGGTLDILTGQNPGVYTSAPFDVSVAYN